MQDVASKGRGAHACFDIISNSLHSVVFFASLSLLATTKLGMIPLILTCMRYADMF